MRGLIAFLVLVVACDNVDTSGPYDGLPVDGSFTVGLDKPAQVGRDKYGVAHIYAKGIADAAFVQGYVMAHDRLPQMDILRRYGAGTLSELFGAADAKIIDTDLEMRMHRMKPLAQESWTALQAGTTDADKQIVLLLQRFADGVNAYADDLNTGKWTIDEDVAASFDITRFAAWEPVDSLVLGRFQAFALSWSTPFELDATELYQKLRTTYDGATTDPAALARKGISADLMRFAPVAATSTIDGFPNVTTDGCTRSDQELPDTCPALGDVGFVSPLPQMQRPSVPQALLDNAHQFFQRGNHTGPFGALGPHAFMHPYAGSNNWAVKTADGALLATDQHLQLPNPSIFYPTHLTITDPAHPVDVLGITFPGIPGVILGTNGKVAWAATVSEHDVNDVYLEDTSGCGGHCTKLNGADVPIQTFTEVINIGALGTMTDSRTVTYELTPHGPIIPTIDHTAHTLAPRTGTTALSVQYTGYQPTFEIRALYNLDRAQNVDQAFQALGDFSYGSQNWTMIDIDDAIAWTTNAVVPDRDPRAYTWNAKTNPDGMAPFFILPGTGEAEWQGRMDSRYVPHAIDRDHPGFLATANADPVGATFDNDPLNQPVVAGRPLYAGVTYTEGLREERITNLLSSAPSEQATLDQMSAIQHDSNSTVGPHFVQAMLAALAGTTTAPDVAAYLASLSPQDTQRLATAKTLLTGWTFATPPAVDTATAQEQTDSAATSVFNMWMHFFIIRTLEDELDAIQYDWTRLDDAQTVRIVYALLARPADFVQNATTHQPELCDDYTTVTDDSCTKMILAALVDAMAQLESSQGFGTADVTAWRWGKLHHLTIAPLFPNAALNLPTGAESPLGGFPKAGDNFVVNRADMGWQDTNFSQFADGPAQRFLAQTVGEAGKKTISVKWALPGGVIYDKRSPHYRDLLDNYYLPLQHFDAPYTAAEIVANGESRWDFK